MITKETTQQNADTSGGVHVNSEENAGSDIRSYVKIGIDVMNAPTIYANKITQKNATGSIMEDAIAINVDFYTHQELNQEVNSE